MPWVLEKLFSLEVVENSICLGGACKQMLFLKKKVPSENEPNPSMSRIEPENNE